MSKTQKYDKGWKVYWYGWFSDADDITEPYIKYLITMMFKTTSLFIKVVCLNNTYNLSLISGAYNDFDFLI